MAAPKKQIKKEELRAIEHEVTSLHISFGPGGSSIGQRRPDDDEGGSGGSGLQPHPITSNQRYFSGMPENISANTQTNQDVEHNAQQLSPEQRPQLTLSNDLTHGNTNSSIPKPRPAGA